MKILALVPPGAKHGVINTQEGLIISNSYPSLDELLVREIGVTTAQSVAEMARRIDKDDLPEHGQIGKGRAKDRGYIITSNRGDEPEYLTARIARDNPDLPFEFSNHDLTGQQMFVYYSLLE